MGMLYILSISLGLIALPLLVMLRRDQSKEKTIIAHRKKSSRFLNLPNGARVHYCDEGNADGSVVVLVHGFMASLYDFDLWAKTLGKDHRVIRLDMPGMGLTGSFPGIDHSLAGRAQFLKAFLDKLNIESATIAGHSLGGGVAWVFALMYPEIVQRLVLVSAAGFDQATEPRSPPLGFRIAETPILRGLARVTGSQFMVARSLEGVVHDPAIVDAEWVRRATDMTLMGNNRASILALRPFRSPENDVARMADIKMPTLILWGVNDYLIPVRHGHLFAHRIKGSQLVTYADVAHYPQIEAAEQSAQDVLSFLSSSK